MKIGMKTAVQTAALMAILTMVSKLFGFVREMVMANYFGASYITDAYTMSFTILTVLFGGIIASISTAYMPIFSRISENEGKEEGDRFTSKVINILLIIAIIISLFGIVFSDPIIGIFASGFSGETAKLASFFVKVLFSYIIFSSTAGILEAYLQYKGIFLPQILSGYFISLVTIVAIVISAHTSCYYLAFGMLGGYALKLVAILVISKRAGFRHSFTVTPDKVVREIMTLAFPTFIGTYMGTINQFIDKTLASRLVEGSIAALNYAGLLNGMIMGVTITVLSTIIYPKLTQANTQEKYERFNDIADTGLYLIIMIALPCSLGAMVYSSQVVQIVYERGVFDSAATAMTSSAFLFYSIGLVFTSVNDLLTRVYYSMHDMKNPMIFAGIGVIINVVLNLILVHPMKHNGLALATSIAAILCTVLLERGLHRKYKNIRLLKSKSKLLKIIIASIISVGSSYLVYSFVIIPLNDVIVPRILQLLLAVAVAVLAYLALLAAFKVEEIKLLGSLVKKSS